MIAIVFAFAIVLYATKNIIITAFSMVSVAFVVSGVVSVMVARGWQMGVSESISIVILIGFSIDYVVHLAAHYTHSGHQTREARAREALAEMGVSILSGGVTTFGSGVCLFGGKVLFFPKFALIITSTVGISLAYSLVYFMSLCLALGPEGASGHVDLSGRLCPPQKTTEDADRSRANTIHSLREEKEARKELELSLKVPADFLSK